jgi:hypothetical protein
MIGIFRPEVSSRFFDRHQTLLRLRQARGDEAGLQDEATKKNQTSDAQQPSFNSGNTSSYSTQQ